MEKIYQKAVLDRIENSKNKLYKNYDKIKDNLRQIMEEHLSNGYYGFELLRDPFLWRDECKIMVNDFIKQVRDKNYDVFMNSKYHTVTIIPNKTFGITVKDSLIGFGTDVQFIHYTIEDETTDSIKIWKKYIDDWKILIDSQIKRLESTVELIWYSPGMPGYEETKQKFDKKFLKLGNNL